MAHVAGTRRRAAGGSRGFHPLAARVALACLLVATAAVHAQEPPQLTKPVNDFAGVIDPESERAMDSLIRALQQASGDVVVVAAVETFAPYGELREYAVKMFENGGRGIGQKGRDNGLLVVLAVKDRQVWIEVGYDLEEFITDGFAGETSRQVMIPEFRRGRYGVGLRAGVTRVIERIAQARNVDLQGVPAQPARPPGGGGVPFAGLFLLFILFNLIAGRMRRRRRSLWWGGPIGGWHSGVGPFGGGFGGRGGFGGGGFGGGFGGFGGGRSGGGGGGGGW